ncbi:site-2 protease family protein [Brevibacterium luteolum]|uniref:M50 family metallopeptidase n=1 Tax=Brevibacterium luteolum TaxID=199591 RepID=UPI00223A9EC4|nr:site-2 protease family protein [Brevibacterium luteolum]MCT1922164.1 site-2 protease family protein [Brevibacterium luteolum]
MTSLLYALGIVLILIGVSISIALHELGHLIPAKKFGVKVTHYMVGFGPTLFSRRRGETEYGIKALPLGGFIAMPGMYPPKHATHATVDQSHGATDASGIVTEAVEGHEDRELAGVGASAEAAGGSTEIPTESRKPRMFERTMDDAREYSNQFIEPGEEHRTFYALSVPKRLVVMFGGPLVNLLLGILILGIMLLGVGVPTLNTTVATVSECAVPATEMAKRAPADQNRCLPGDQPTPAAEVGIAPGNTIISIDGKPMHSWNDITREVRGLAGKEVDIVVEDGGAQKTIPTTIIAAERPVYEKGELTRDGNGELVTETVGFLGVGPDKAYTPIPLSEFPGQIGQALGRTFTALATLPVKLVDIVQVATTNKERDPEGIMGMVGVGRVAGEIVSTDQIDVTGKVVTGLGLLGSLNLFLFAFNMIPLLPLDGGHIAVALYEGARRRINLARGRGIIGPFDTARLLPLTYVVVGLMLCMTVLLVYVDIVKPVVLFQ